MSQEAESSHPLFQLLRISDAMVGLVVLGIVLMLIVPLPCWLLDMLLIVNIAGAILTIQIAINLKEPLEFAVFPSLLLMATLFRLGLDVSATRMILLNGSIKDPVTHMPIGAGHLIPAFGEVVVGGNLLVGFVMFVILLVIQILVITNGAERIAQVAARFTLDKMPGEQMAIDADLGAGLIDADTAKARRAKVQRAADFYGSMDGAGKFIKGDAIAAIVIMVVNVVGGLVMGCGYFGMSAGEALQTYAVLSIGNGLITTLPAFLMSTSMGIIVSRAASSSNLARDLVLEILGQPQALRFSAFSLLLLGFLGLTGLFAFPAPPFFALGGAMLYGHHLLSQERQDVQARQENQKAEVQREVVKNPERAVINLGIDPLSLEVGRGLLALVDPGQGAKLLERVTAIRRHISLEMGLILPGVRFRDNLQLKPNAYVIKIREIEVAQGEVQPGQFLAIGPADKLKSLRGLRTVDPTYSMPGIWLPPEQRGDAERLGCMLFDPVSVIATQLTEVVRNHADQLLHRQDVQGLLDHVKKTHPAVVKEVVGEGLGLGEVQKVLQNLVRERVSIRDMVVILECLADHMAMTRDTEMLTEFVRSALCRNICKDYVNAEGVLQVLTLDPVLESRLQTTSSLSPGDAQEVMQALDEPLRRLQEKGLQPILLTSPGVRARLRRLTERSWPQLVVLSWNEIAPRVQVHSLDMVTC